MSRLALAGFDGDQAKSIPRFDIVMEPADLYAVFDNHTGCPAESGGISLIGMTAENAARSRRLLLGENEASDDRANAHPELVSD